ncbi:MAG: acyltransferase, partial [Methylococcaceae bacterium]
MKALIRKEPIFINTQLSATLDFLRWVSALLVLSGHVRTFYFPTYGKFINPDIFTKFFYVATGFGHQAVMIFFVLSGFLVGGRILEKLENNSFKLTDYTLDRFTRLYPVFLVSLLVTLLCDWLGFTYFNHTGIYSVIAGNPIGVINYNVENQWGVADFLTNLFMLQGLTGSIFGSNCPLWSISMEFWYYFLFPALLLPFYIKSLQHRCISILLLIAIACLLSLNVEFYTLFLVWPLGVLIRRVRIPFCNTPFAFIVFFCLLFNSRYGYGSEYSRDLLMAIGCILVIASMLNGGYFPVFGAKFSKWAADFSYSVYCCHFPVITLVTAIIGINVNEATLTLSVRYQLFTGIMLLAIT